MYLEMKPSIRLRKFVECYWTRLAEEHETKHTILPDGSVDHSCHESIRRATRA